MPFLVPIIESERGWGQKVDERPYFRDGDKAHEYVRSFNAKNTLSHVPDIYWRAEKPQYVETKDIRPGTKFEDDPVPFVDPGQDI